MLSDEAMNLKNTSLRERHLTAAPCCGIWYFELTASVTCTHAEEARHVSSLTTLRDPGTLIAANSPVPYSHCDRGGGALTPLSISVSLRPPASLSISLAL